MEQDTKKLLKSSGIGLLIVILLVGFLSFVLPSAQVDTDCYKQIAFDECNKKGQKYTYFQGSPLFGQKAFFTCCEMPKDNNSRLAIDRRQYCEDYVFLKEDDNKCSKRYRYWKRTN